MNDAGHGIGIADSVSLAVRDKRALFADIPEKTGFNSKAESMPRFPLEVVDVAWNEKSGLRVR